MMAGPLPLIFPAGIPILQNLEILFGKPLHIGKI